MPHTGTIWSERNPALDTHGDNAYSPQIPDTKLMVTSKVQFLQLQHVFRQNAKNTIPHVRWHTLPPQPSQHLITPFRLNTNKLKLYESCSTKSKPNIPCCKWKPISKNTFRPSPSYFFFIILLLFLTNLARALQHSSRKQYNLNTHTLHPSSSLTTNFPSLLTNQLLQLKSSYTKLRLKYQY